MLRASKLRAKAKPIVDPATFESTSNTPAKPETLKTKPKTTRPTNATLMGKIARALKNGVAKPYPIPKRKSKYYLSFITEEQLDADGIVDIPAWQPRLDRPRYLPYILHPFVMF
ncbi:hypothetical protein PQX77_009401 [Marasmius sp. AFHP31]|nr:hypothetical protein PQX77_009401 [Marasmius sp. AFHP31]